MARPIKYQLTSAQEAGIIKLLKEGMSVAKIVEKFKGKVKDSAVIRVRRKEFA